MTPADRSAADGAHVLADHGRRLAEGIDAALEAWVVRCVARIAEAWSGAVDPDLLARAAEAGREARRDVGPRVAALLASDVDQQSTTPLAIVRSAVRYPTEVLRSAGVPPVVRDELAEAGFPDDDYDLSPGSFADIDPALAEPGLVWGAAKAHVVLARRRG